MLDAFIAKGEANALGKTTIVNGAKGVTAQGYLTTTGSSVEKAAVEAGKVTAEGASGVASYAAGQAAGPFASKVFPPSTNITSAVVPTLTPPISTKKPEQP